MQFSVISKIKVLLVAIIAMSLIFAPSCFATDDACDVAGFDDPLICGSGGGDEESELQGRIKSALTTVYTWVGIIAVIVIVIGGILYMTSAGNPEKAKTAKNAIMYAVIGLVVTLMAFAITTLVIDAIDGKTPTSSGGGGGGGAGGGGGGGGGGGSSDRTAVRGVKMTLSAGTLTVGESGTANASVIPDYAKDKTIKYTSSKEAVATIDKNGKIKAKKAGKTTIKATSGNGKSASKTLTVVKQVEAESVKIKEGDVTVAVGKTTTLTAEISPKNTANKTITWSSNKTDIATVDKNGKVKGIKAGTAKITAKTSNGKKDTVKVTVSKDAVGDGGKSIDTSSRHKIGNALAVMHAANDGDISKVKQAGEKKYYAVECDVFTKNNKYHCLHDSKYISSKNPTLDETVRVAKQHGMRLILDHVYDSSAKKVAQYIKNNDLQGWIIVQIYKKKTDASDIIGIMKTMNGVVGSKLEYFGCHMLSMSATGYKSHASEIKNLGMTAVNVQTGKDSAMQEIKGAGFDLSVFTWTSYGNNAISKYNGSPYNAKYMMTNNVSVN